MLSVLLVVLAGCAVGAVMGLIHKWILSPLREAAKVRCLPIRFSIGDFLCLFVNVQFPLGALAWIGSIGLNLPTLFIVFIAALGIVIWFESVRRLSQAGVSSGKERFIFLGLIVPISTYGVPFLVGFPPIEIMSMTSGEPKHWDRILWALMVWVTVGAVLVVCGLYVRGLGRRIGVKVVTPESSSKSSNGV